MEIRFLDYMFDINIIGTKNEQRVGAPLHMCAVCELPIAMYGRLVCTLHINYHIFHIIAMHNKI